MDIKAMAKSKRSHTRHHQPRKHPHPLKTPAPSSSSSASADSADPKLAKKEGRESKRPVQPPSLPSNWDRYEDEGSDDGERQVAELSIGSASDEPSRLTDSKAKAVPEEVKPKSKGANFGELIAQAKESGSSYSSYAPSFHETLPDFYQGLGPMLSVRGESILSWEGRDDFLADEEATTTQEAPFLRLDLQDLAEQLAKIDLAERLFIEPDLLPPELRGREANESDHEMLLEKSKKQKKARVPETFDELLSLYLEEEQNAEQEKDEDKEDAKSVTAAISASTLDQDCSANMTDSKLDDIVFQDSRETSSITLVTEKDSKPSSVFEAAAAEAELDMLLNSFSETKLFDPSATESEVATSKKQPETRLPLKEDSSLDIPITSSLDDALDNLLEETSTQDHKGSLSQSAEIKTTSFEFASSTSSSHPSSKSKVLQDFDSWFDTI